MNDYGTLLDVSLPITNPRGTGVESKPTLDCEVSVSSHLNNGTMNTQKTCKISFITISTCLYKKVGPNYGIFRGSTKPENLLTANKPPKQDAVLICIVQTERKTEIWQICA